MNHTDHVNLLRPANLSEGGTWADFGAGGGAFTLALRELIGPDAAIYALDKNRASLNELEQAYRARFASTLNLHLLPKDFPGVSMLRQAQHNACRRWTVSSWRTLYTFSMIGRKYCGMSKLS